MSPRHDIAMRIVMHVDMDAFFAAIEERYNLQFRGRPLVVGADPKGGKGRGVVSTANYPARKFGIRSALPISQAWRFAEEARKRGEPETIFLEGNYRLYGEVSDRIMAILSRMADAFEQASVDEAYLEWRQETRNGKSEIKLWEEAKKRAGAIKRKILEEEGLTCSVGIGPNKLVAKIASDFKKPDGLTVVPMGEVEAFLRPMGIRAIPGIGPKSEQELNRHGIKTIADLQRMTQSKLVEVFGAWGEDMYRKARGISDSPVSNEWEAKSIGEQETFAEDTLQAAFILERLKGLSETVFRRFRRDGFSSFRTVVATVRFADFTTMTRSHTAKKPMTAEKELYAESLRLLLPFLDKRENPQGRKIRLIGVRVEKLA